MSQSAIRKILETRLATWAATRTPALPVLWQNVTVPVEPSGDHLRAYLLPATTNAPDLAGEMRSYKGVFQVSAFLAPGAGPARAEAIAAELDALFPCYELFSGGGVTVQVATPVSVAAGVPEPGWYPVVMSFRYRCEN